MKTITLPTLKLLVVEVPESAISIYVDNNGTLFFWTSQNGDPHEWSGFVGYVVLGFLNEITEDQAKGIVEHFTDYEVMKQGYKNYQSPFEDDLFDTANKSFHSLMQANGVTGNELILIEKI